MTRGSRAVLVFGLLALAAAAAAADAQPIAQPIHHGQQVTAASVGPLAAGYRNLNRYTGTAIKDGATYPFARAVAETAIYDGFAVPGPHLLIENAAFDSALDIYTTHAVVLRGVSVRPASHSPVALLTRPGAGPVYVLWSDFGGNGGRAVDAAIALRADHTRVYRSYISGAADGVSLSGSDIQISESLITTRAASAGDHNDAIQLLGTPTRIAIVRNRISNPNPQTSCITILGSHITVRDNYLSGGGWTIYGGANANGKGGGSATGVSVSNTIFGRDTALKSGHFGPVTYWDKANTWTDNRFDDGKAIAP